MTLAVRVTFIPLDFALTIALPPLTVITSDDDFQAIGLPDIFSAISKSDVALSGTVTDANTSSDSELIYEYAARKLTADTEPLKSIFRYLPYTLGE